MYWSNHRYDKDAPSALGRLAGVFQKAIDGLTEDPPRIALMALNDKIFLQSDPDPISK